MGMFYFLLVLVQMLMATQKGGRGGVGVNGQIPLRNSKTFCRCSLSSSKLQDLWGKTYQYGVTNLQNKEA